MAKLPSEVVESKAWEALVEYIEKRMAFIRRTDGKLNIKNEELWRLKKAMQEVDPTIERVGKTFNEHENAGYDTKEGAK